MKRVLFLNLPEILEEIIVAEVPTGHYIKFGEAGDKEPEFDILVMYLDSYITATQKNIWKNQWNKQLKTGHQIIFALYSERDKFDFTTELGQQAAELGCSAPRLADIIEIFAIISCNP